MLDSPEGFFFGVVGWRIWKRCEVGELGFMWVKLGFELFDHLIWLMIAKCFGRWNRIIILDRKNSNYLLVEIMNSGLEDDGAEHHGNGSCQKWNHHLLFRACNQNIMIPLFDMYNKCWRFDKRWILRKEFQNVKGNFHCVSD